MKKYLVLFLSVVLMFSLAVPAMADDPPEAWRPGIEDEQVAVPLWPGKLTLNGAQPGHTYTAYQIFTGDLKENEGVDTLSNIVWGFGVTEEGKEKLGDAAAIAEELETVEDAEAFAASVAPYLGTAAGSVAIDDNATSGVIDNLPAGYYLIKTTVTTQENGVYTYYIMKVIGDTTATIKADVPSVEKTVNDTDANIGDTLTFTLTATMPSDIQGYETYKIIFHDTMSKGLAYVDIQSVTVAGVPVTSGYTVTPVVKEDGTTELTITFANVKAQGAVASSEIVVTYNAVLDDDACINYPDYEYTLVPINPDTETPITETDEVDFDNPNTVYLEYSNDPNWTGSPTDEPTGKTPPSVVTINTWAIKVFKYTKGLVEAPPAKKSAFVMGKIGLPGAGFTLYRSNNEIETIVNVFDYTNEEGVAELRVCSQAGCTDHEHKTEIVTGDSGVFHILGLKPGTYILRETTVPAGYNKCEDITITIDENGKVYVNNDPEPVNRVEIENNAGSILPETGGIGTTIFYIAGGVMVVAAVVLLVTKKRMSKEG